MPLKDRTNQHTFTAIPEQMVVLKKAASDMGVPYADVIRWAITDYLAALGYDFPQVEYKRGRVPKGK